MRKSNGVSLVEMAVAIGLSSMFILLLSSMLAQTLRISTATQNELIASSAAEILLENAKLIPYEKLNGSSALVLDKNYELVVNKKASSFSDFPARTLPIQIDLIDNNTIFGSVDATQGNFDTSRKWTETSGNHFRGTAVETLTDATGVTGGLPAVEITVKITYPFTESSAMRTLSRSAIVFKDGASH